MTHHLWWQLQGMLSIAKYGIVTEINLSVQNCLVGIDTHLTLWAWLSDFKIQKQTELLFLLLYLSMNLSNLGIIVALLHLLVIPMNYTITPLVRFNVFSSSTKEHFILLPSSPQVGRNLIWCKKAATRWNVEEGGCRKPFADP